MAKKILKRTFLLLGLILFALSTVIISSASAEVSIVVSEDFESYAAGSDPTNWYDTGAGNSLTQDDSLFKVFDLSGEKVFGTTSTATNIHSHYNGAGNEGFSIYTYSGRMMMTDTDGGIGVTFLSQYPVADVYYRLRSEPTDSNFYISPHGTEVTGETHTGVNPAANTWYSFKIEVQNTGGRTEIRAKVWDRGTSLAIGRWMSTTTVPRA